MIDKIIAPALVTFGLMFVAIKSDRPLFGDWTPVGSNAYVEAINNTQMDLPVLIQAPAVDSATRLLGIVPKCSHRRFKLPYVETKVIFLVAESRKEMLVDKPGLYSLEIDSKERPCVFVTKTVFRIADFIDPMRWNGSPYRRQEDLTAPMKAVMAGDNTVCAIWELEVADIRVGEPYTCKTAWRIARP